MMWKLSVALALVAVCGGCVELRGRKKIQEGTAAYKRGDFVGAVARFKEAVAFVPDKPIAWLNLGYSCRELIVPGAPSGENRAPALCALDAFKHLRELAPGDPRGDHLYVQTLFDAGEYKTIERTFSVRHERQPDDLDVILALEQVHVRLGHWRDALVYYRKAAALRPNDSEAAYAIGTFIWQTLVAHGGGPVVDGYDPRPRPNRPDPPVPAANDLTGPERIALAEEGITHLERAVALRPHYAEALTYIGLLYRQESFARFDDPAAWDRAMAQSRTYLARATERP
jgi:tetratricopeptide (TPR) repeat protein